MMIKVKGIRQIKGLLLALTTSVLTYVIALTATAAQPAPQEHTDSPQPKPAHIVLIIDDMGNSLELGLQAIDLPGPINYAFLPHSRHAVTLANRAHLQDKEILLHAPMSNLRDYPTGPGTLTPAMDEGEFLHTLQSDLQSVPHIRGVNNHMGSLLTQLHQPMSWLMQTLKEQQLYFVDSRTTPLTVAERTGRRLKVPTLKRDIFLDNKRQQQAITLQFNRLIELAREQGSAVAIGHPYPETIATLQQILPTLASQNIRLLRASDLANNCLYSPPKCSHSLNLANIKK